MRSPVDGEASTPVFYARPPYDRTRETQQRQTHCADAVHQTARHSREQIRVKIHDPLDREPSRKLVAINNDAAGDAHYRNIQADYRSHPKVDLKQDISQPYSLWVLQPALPPRHSSFVVNRLCRTHERGLLLIR